MRRILVCLITAAVVTLSVITAIIHLKAEPAGEVDSSAAAPNGLVAAYFHGTIRCPACLDIERLSRHALEEMFATEMERGELVWRSINYDRPGNERYQEHYQLPYPSLVISRFEGGVEKEWRLLDKTWKLQEEDPEALMVYVQEEVVSLFTGEPTGLK